MGSDILIAIILACQMYSGSDPQKDCRENLIKCIKEEMTRGYDEDKSLTTCLAKK